MINLLGTQGWVGLNGSMGTDLTIANSARRSYGIEHTDLATSDEALIARLMDKHHMSPFESVEFQFSVKAPLFVVRQWQRHRTWSYNETSRRYTGKDMEFYIPSDWRMKNEGGAATDTVMSDMLTGVVHQACGAYNYMLANGVPRELARSVLPQNMMVQMLAKVDLRNLLHFLTLRLDKHAQWEMQEYARALHTLVSTVVPITMREFDKRGQAVYG